MNRMTLFIVICIVVIYMGIHHHHYRRNRRNGFGMWYSMRGPWGTRIRISKRL